MRHLPSSLVALLVLSSLSTGCLGSQASVLDRSWELPPGTPAEVNLEMPAGANITVTFQADQPVAWDIHSHGQEGPVIHQEGEDARGALSFSAPSAGGYSVMWTPTDGSQAWQLEVAIDGQAEVVSTSPP